MSSEKISFFVVGYPRSGTTMAAALLSRNPDIYISPETHFFRLFLPNMPKSNSRDALISAFVKDKRLSDIGATRYDLKKFSPETSNVTWLLNTALAIKAREAKKSIIGEKTPAHLINYKEIFKYYPNSKFIVIIRDGRDCVLSNIKEDWTFSDPVKHAAEWNFYINIHKELIKNHRDQVLTVHYEDILDAPEKTVKKMTEFVGGTFNASQIKNDETPSVIPEWEKNWKSKAAKAPDKENKYKWKKHSNKNLLIALTFIMRSNLFKHSYDITNLSDCSAAKKITLYSKYFIYMPNIYPIMLKLATTTLYKIIKSRQKIK